MKGKKEYIVLAAIIIAVVAYLAMRQTDRSHYQLPKTATVEKKDISKIEITGPGVSDSAQPVTIVYKNDQWRISPEDYPVDPEKLGRILDTVSGLKLTAMVAESKNDLRYDLGPKKRIQVKAWAGKDLKRDFQVGKAANTFRHTFVKIAGDDRVFHAEDNFRDRFDVTVDTLRDKTVLAFKTNEINTFTIIKDGKTTVFSKKKTSGKAEEVKSPDAKETTPAPGKTSQWTTADNQPADPDKVRSFLSALSGLKCQTFLDDHAKADLKDPVVSITLSGTRTYRLSVYAQKKKEDNDSLWPAQSSENDFPFMLADWRAKDIVKNPADLMPETPREKETGLLPKKPTTDTLIKPGG